MGQPVQRSPLHRPVLRLWPCIPSGGGTGSGTAAAVRGAGAYLCPPSADRATDASSSVIWSRRLAALVGFAHSAGSRTGSRRPSTASSLAGKYFKYVRGDTPAPSVMTSTVACSSPRRWARDRGSWTAVQVSTLLRSQREGMDGWGMHNCSYCTTAIFPGDTVATNAGPVLSAGDSRRTTAGRVFTESMPHRGGSGGASVLVRAQAQTAATADFTLEGTPGLARERGWLYIDALEALAKLSDGKSLNNADGLTPKRLAGRRSRRDQRVIKAVSPRWEANSSPISNCCQRARHGLNFRDGPRVMAEGGALRLHERQLEESVAQGRENSRSDNG
ncbi:hypothetical protein J2808_000014 [Pseudarthrobacter sulfonivorans]|nr:hypothetical protein [Pseudarthrobacter sulfonivorans]